LSDHEDEHPSAMLIASLAPVATLDALPPTRARRENVQNAAVEWQLVGARGSFSEMLSVTGGKWAPPFKHDWVNRICGLMGSAGEQLAMAWTAEQDAQRWLHRSATNDVHHRRMAVRALCETAMLFTLGAAHAAGNASLRTVLLDVRTARGLRELGVERSFEPVSTTARDWPSFTPRERIWAQLERAAGQGGSRAAVRLTDRLLRLLHDARYASLLARRNADFHRHRPPSLPTGSPRQTLWEFDHTARQSTLHGYGAVNDPDHDEREVHKVAWRGLVAVAGGMRDLRAAIEEAAAGGGYRILGPGRLTRSD
jgi:hypothetical protein